MPLNLSTFEVPELVDEVMSELGQSSGGRRCGSPEDVPQPPADQKRPAEGETDRAQSLSNALKFTPAGSVTISAS